MSTLPKTNQDERPGAARARHTPRWVKVLGAIALVLLVAFVVSRLFGIQHGPDLHGRLPLDLAVAAGFSQAV